MAIDWIQVIRDPAKRRAFWNTVVGLPFEEKKSKAISVESLSEQGEVWEAKPLADPDDPFERPVYYVPDQVAMITLGIDVQQGSADGSNSRFAIERVGWGAGEESWSIDYDEPYANTRDLSEWDRVLVPAIETAMHRRDGRSFLPMAVCIDAGNNPDQAASFVAKHQARLHARGIFLFAVKGIGERGKAVYPRCAIVSITLHLDEQTPHLHVIVLPVRERIDARFADKCERWTLSARGDLPPKREKGAPPIDYSTYWRGGMGSRGQMAYEQTVFAKVMAPLGLERGRVWSGAPNKPNSIHQAEMRDAIAAANSEREALVRSRQQLEDDRAKIADMGAEIKRQRVELEASLARAREEEARLAEQRRALHAERAEFEEKLQKARAWKAKQDANIARVKAEHDRLVKQAPLVADLAEASIKALRSIDLDRVGARERDAVMRAAYAIGRPLEAAESVHWTIDAARREITATSSSRSL